MAHLIKTDSSYIEVQPKNGQYFSLEELQEYVGGYIELVTLPNTDEYMVINEEGKLHNLPKNGFATAIAKEQNAIMDYDYIGGNVLIGKQSEI